MIEIKDLKVETTGVQRIIKVMFKHERKQSNEGYVSYIPSKFYPMFLRHIEEICKDTVAAGNVQFLKKWNKIGKSRVQNRGKNNVNVLACKILGKSNMVYSSYCWIRSIATNFADVGMSFIQSNMDNGNLTEW